MCELVAKEEQYHLIFNSHLYPYFEVSWEITSGIARSSNTYLSAVKQFGLLSTLLPTSHASTLVVSYM